ncbi:MAG: hypothetical protein ACUZ8O_10405 [Candidatus Anammoxibacter sp.]
MYAQSLLAANGETADIATSAIIADTPNVTCKGCDNGNDITEAVKGITGTPDIGND